MIMMRTLSSFEERKREKLMLELEINFDGEEL
jgi:hypothetical protein